MNIVGSSPAPHPQGCENDALTFPGLWLRGSRSTWRFHGYQFAALMMGHRWEDAVTARGQVTGVVSKALSVFPQVSHCLYDTQ